jgi:bifunctional DNase/RNase
MRSWERNTNIYKISSIVLLLTTLALASYVFLPREVSQIVQEIALPELSTSGFSKVEKVETEITEELGSITLRAGCYDLTATVEPEQAASIQRGIEKTYIPRPNAHDIAANVFDTLKIEVLMVKITELREKSFYSKLILRQGNTVLNLDARPSDAIAIALRTNSTIYVNTTLLKEEGEKIC